MRENFDLRLAWRDIRNDFIPGNILKTLWKYNLIIIGSVILAAGDAFFLIPYNIVSGGVGGLGIIMGLAMSWDVNLTITVLQWALFGVGFLLLGARFTVKTLISSIVYPVFLYIFAYVYKVTPFLMLSEAGDATAVLTLAGIFGGGLVGVGVGLTFVGGGSTGGTDCLSLALTKYANVKASVGSLIIDLLIIFSYVFFTNNILIILIGVVSAVFCALLIDKTYIGGNDSYVAQIVSDNWEAINNHINSDLERGTTLVDSYGGYTGEDKVMIQVVFSKDEYDEIQKIVFRNDPHAFLSIIKATEVNGYGFRKVPFRINREIRFEQRQRIKRRNQRKNIRKIKDLKDSFMLPAEKIAPTIEKKSGIDKTQIKKEKTDDGK